MSQSMQKADHSRLNPVESLTDIISRVIFWLYSQTKMLDVTSQFPPIWLPWFLWCLTNPDKKHLDFMCRCAHETLPFFLLFLSDLPSYPHRNILAKIGIEDKKHTRMKFILKHVSSKHFA